MQCLAVLREDKSRFLFPLFSAIAIVLVYRFADGDTATGGLDADLLGGAFRARD